MAIQDKDALYSMLEAYMSATFNLAYSEVEYVGAEKIPTDGAVIFAPNHTNAFMDALAVLKMANSPAVFVARADMFQNPLLVKILTFLKIMPIMRIRDGRENLKKNDDIMRKATDVLRAGVPFCIMSEGTHRMQHSLLPLVKGIFRIALQANDLLGGKIPVYIVPMGIEYGSYTKFYSHLTLQVGDPINVTEYVNSHSDLDTPELVMSMRGELSERMKSLIHYIPDNDDYDAILDCSYLRNREVRSELGLKNSPMSRLTANRKTVDDLQFLERNSPSDYETLMSDLREFADLRRKLKISDETLYDKAKWGGVCKRIFMMIVSFVYFVFSVAVSFPVILISEIRCVSLEDKAFNNSFRYMFLLLIFPIACLVYVIILSSWLPWYALIAFVALAIPSYSFAHLYAFWFRQVKSDIKFLTNKKLLSVWHRLKS
jgi:1-acyl-sn-glycerol-3-phosphate acyltransferase